MGLPIDKIGSNAIKVVSATVKMGRGLAIMGYYKLADWTREMRKYIGKPLKENFHLTDEEVDRMIAAMWDTPVMVDGKLRKVSELAKEMELEELRGQMRKSVEEKIEEQKKAEKTAVVWGDLANIKDNLPFLYPAQHEDVLKAETQFFSQGHSDRKHGRGKGYLFTNATGTGKTFTGLGIVKRFIKQGKGRILIVTASDEKIKDWVKDAAKLGIEATALEDTKSKGSGVVVTQYANMRQNLALLEDEFDLVVYDESHKLQENQHGMATATAAVHHMLSNRDAEQAVLRTLQKTPLWQRERDIAREISDIQRLLQTAETKRDAETDAELRKLGGGGGAQNRLQELNSELGEVKRQQEAALREAMADPAKREAGEKAANRTKAVFLSATPFNTALSLDYAEGYIFSYGDEERQPDRDKRRASFVMSTFPSSHKRQKGGNVTRLLDTQITDPQAASQEEVAFSDRLQNELGTMSGRALDSPYDYSREFPKVDFPMAGEFNRAVEALSTGEYSSLSPYFKSLFNDYAQQTAIFEILKTETAITRAGEHLAQGRKVVIFHRRMASARNVQPPFRSGLDAAKKEKGDIRMLADKFEKDFGGLLNWEKTIDFGKFPHERIMEAFATEEEKEAHRKAVDEWTRKGGKGKRPRLKSKAVAEFNGQTSESQRSEGVVRFNTDDSGCDVIVVQIQSGKEGISLHDTTGRRQRAQISISLPESPLEFIQAEGRIFRIGNKSDAIFEYPMLGVDLETASFAGKISGRSQTAENLALGSRGRGLRDSIMRGVLASRSIPVTGDMGRGGKAFDDKSKQNRTDFDEALDNYQQTQAEEAGLDPSKRSVPDPIGFKLCEWAGAESGETVLVPNAGRGTVARYVGGDKKLIATEAATGPFSRLVALVGGGGRRVENAVFDEDFRRPSNNADAVICSADDARLALKMVNDCGRLVVVAGDKGLTRYPAGYCGLESLHRLLNNETELYHPRLVADIVMPGEVTGLAGKQSHVLVYDVRTGWHTKNPQGEVQLTDLSGITDKSELFRTLRGTSVPKREIDQRARVDRRLRKHVDRAKKLPYTESGERCVVSDDTNFFIRFKKRTLAFPDIRETGAIFPDRYRDFRIRKDWVADGNLPYIQALAKTWVEFRAIAEGEKEPTYQYGYNHIQDKEAIPEVYKELAEAIADALGKNEMQTRNLAEGRAENTVSGTMTLGEFRNAFDALNKGAAETAALADRVFAAAGNIEGLEISVVPQQEMTKSGGGAGTLGMYSAGGGKHRLLLNDALFNSFETGDEKKAQCIVHELIHALTSYCLRADKAGDTDWMTKEQKAAVKDIKEVYDAINNSDFRARLRLSSKVEDNAEYGLTDADEMLAELSNPKFREQLKLKGLWRQTINGVKRLLGMDVTGGGEGKTTAEKTLAGALDTLMDTYNPKEHARIVGRLAGASSEMRLSGEGGGGTRFRETDPDKVGEATD
ncbi:MAG: DEAD/DEAH box helicase family protein, partial [Clostridia bacterium]|nr:DEAD/DEAH box helicase family protein [Clostridia bacterium]